MDLPEMPTHTDQPEMGVYPPGPPSLSGLPDELQRALAQEVLKTTPRRATDLWYEDEQDDRLFVLRGGIQWELNPTAKMIWRRIEEGTQTVVEDLIGEYGAEQEHAILTAAVEFLVQADYFGLIELYPKSIESGS